MYRDCLMQLRVCTNAFTIILCFFKYYILNIEQLNDGKKLKDTFYLETKMARWRQLTVLSWLNEWVFESFIQNIWFIQELSKCLCIVCSTCSLNTVSFSNETPLYCSLTLKDSVMPLFGTFLLSKNRQYYQNWI